MDEFVGTATLKATESVDHASSDSFCNPDIAVENPDERVWRAFGFSVSTTHVTDLGVRPKLGEGSLLQLGVVLLDEDLDVELRKVIAKLTQSGQSWIISV